MRKEQVARRRMLSFIQTPGKLHAFISTSTHRLKCGLIDALTKLDYTFRCMMKRPSSGINLRSRVVEANALRTPAMEVLSSTCYT
jgi:hypothetical protein